METFLQVLVLTVSLVNLGFTIALAGAFMKFVSSRPQRERANNSKPVLPPTKLPSHYDRQWSYADIVPEKSSDLVLLKDE
jgi:hypothetical protein